MEVGLQALGETRRVLSCCFHHRNLVQEKAQVDPEQVAVMVDYIRRQVWHMDQLSSELLLRRGTATLLALHS